MFRDFLARVAPAVAVPLTGSLSQESMKALKSRVDVVEIRADLFAHRHRTEVVKRELASFKEQGVATILTARSQAERGGWSAPEADRLQLMAECYAGASAIDIEISTCRFDTAGAWSALARAIAASETELIASYHHFERTPPYARIRDEILNDGLSQIAGIVKIACTINSKDDLQTLTRVLMDHPNNNLVVVGMGEYGTLTRLVFPAYGSLLTFACLEGMATASGQLPLDEAVRCLRLLYPDSRWKESSPLKGLI